MNTAFCRITDFPLILQQLLQRLHGQVAYGTGGRAIPSSPTFSIFTRGDAARKASLQGKPLDWLQWSRQQSRECHPKPPLTTHVLCPSWP